MAVAHSSRETIEVLGNVPTRTIENRISIEVLGNLQNKINLSSCDVEVLGPYNNSFAGVTRETAEIIGNIANFSEAFGKVTSVNILGQIDEFVEVQNLFNSVEVLGGFSPISLNNDLNIEVLGTCSSSINTIKVTIEILGQI